MTQDSSRLRLGVLGMVVLSLFCAGKTGTAEVTGKQDTSFFTAYAPANAPRYVVSVVLEESGLGASAAAPVARRVLEAIAVKEGISIAPPTAVIRVDGRD